MNKTLITRKETVLKLMYEQKDDIISFMYGDNIFTDYMTKEDIYKHQINELHNTEAKRFNIRYKTYYNDFNF